MHRLHSRSGKPLVSDDGCSRSFRQEHGSVLAIMTAVLSLASSTGLCSTYHPLYQRTHPTPQTEKDFSLDRIDLNQHHLPPYSLDPAIDSLQAADDELDARMAAALYACVGDASAVRVEPVLQWVSGHALFVGTDGKVTPEATAENLSRDLLELQYNGSFMSTSPSTALFTLTAKSLACMAYGDYFPDNPGKTTGANLRSLVSEAIMKAGAGWCGTFGAGMRGQTAIDFTDNPTEGNYDMTQQHLLHIAYRYYDDLASDNVREKLVHLICDGLIERPGKGDQHTRENPPTDWAFSGEIDLAGIDVADIPETENHVLAIATARYLANQLLYQRDHNPAHDNRRYKNENGESCMDQVLGRLQSYLKDDFAEYNSRDYQEESRWALLNLYNYSYDQEVRLAAKMVLEYAAAHFAVSSSDLRRLVPFRRRDEDTVNAHRTYRLTQDPNDYYHDFLEVGFVNHFCDPLTRNYALLAGHTRAFQNEGNRVWQYPDEAAPELPARPWEWGINPAPQIVHETASDFRLPDAIHDLFMNDLHRRWFQRLHRIPMPEPGNQRNCENTEIYSGSPSYLITAGGRPAQWVIRGQHGRGYQTQNLGVAVPTTFIPTGLSAGLIQDPASGGKVRDLDSRDVIQIGAFSDDALDPTADGDMGGSENYGVGPDFACGYKFYLPDWVRRVGQSDSGFLFVDSSMLVDQSIRATERAGFFLALHWDGDFLVMEAFDRWLHPNVDFVTFKASVLIMNSGLHLENNVSNTYTTFSGNVIHFVIWHGQTNQDRHWNGARINDIKFGPGDPVDTLSDGGKDPGPFLSGSVMNSAGDGRIEIWNRSLGRSIVLDMRDIAHPKRISEWGEVEVSGFRNEVWVDFDWKPGNGERPEGDFYRPYITLKDAMAGVADGGVIKIMPGTTAETPVLPTPSAKKFRVVAPIGGVRIGVH